MPQDKPLLLDLGTITVDGKLSFTLPVSKKSYQLGYATGRTQLLAQRLFDPAKRGFEFVLENIRQCITPQPPLEEMLDWPNPDLDFIQSIYSRLNRTGTNGITDSELDKFFKNPSSTNSPE